MARQEQDREDLMREAVAYTIRAEFQTPGADVPVFIGFRRDGCLSIYFETEEVYHWNTDYAVRRAFRDGLLYKAEQGRLVSMRRDRSGDGVFLVRHELTPEETSAFLEQADLRLQTFCQQLSAGDCKPLAEIPTPGTCAARLLEFNQELPRPLTVAKSPHAR